jgi:hypothetical protein
MTIWKSRYISVFIISSLNMLLLMKFLNKLYLTVLKWHELLVYEKKIRLDYLYEIGIVHSSDIVHSIFI